MRRLFALSVLSICSFAQDPLTVDRKHYRVDLENEWVRVLRVHYEPDEGSPMHEHAAGVRVFLTDIHNRFTNADGSASEATRHAGDVIWAESVRHANTVLSRHPVEMIELELKHRMLRPAGPGSTTSPGGAQETVLFENESVRVLRAAVPEHGRLSPHVHRKSVIITVRRSASGDQVVQRNPDSVTAIPKAVVEWAEVAPHTIPDTNTPLEVVVIELKNL